MLKSDTAPNYVLYGNASSIEYQYAKFILATNCQNAEIKGMLSSEFQKLKHEMKKTHSKAPYHHFTKDFLLLKGHTFTALDDIKTFTDVCPIDLKSIASENLYKLLKEIKNPIVEIEMKISDIVQDKIVIQLFDNFTPKTVSKFLEFVSGKTCSVSKIPLSYKNSKVNRVLAGGWMQVGEIRDEKGMIIKESVYEDENFIINHDSPGIVSMVNSGPHSNYSTFMISSSPMPFFDYKYVAFGKVVHGQEIVDKITRVKCAFERPLLDIVINSIRQLEF